MSLYWFCKESGSPQLFWTWIHLEVFKNVDPLESQKEYYFCKGLW